MESRVEIAANTSPRLAACLARARTLCTLCTVLLLAIFVAGCGKRSASTGSTVMPSERVSLRVDNRGYFDVTVYAVRSGGSAGSRLGNISGGSSGTLFVRFADLQPGGRLVVRLRAIGTRRTWTSPAISVADGLRARLNVLSTNSGEMSQSTLIADYSGDD